MFTRRVFLSAGASGAALALAACGSGTDSSTSGDAGRTLRISAIPDQDPDLLTERENLLAQYLSEQLGDVDVHYVPVPDYAASVAQLGTGDLDLVFYGGLTGVQARLTTPGARVLAQRDIDEHFTSVFVAHRDAGLSELASVEELAMLAGKRLTFGSETSTSGRLMPSYFLSQAGLSESDFASEVGFSGSHDATLELVASGSYDVGALNSQVFERAKNDGTLSEDLMVVFTTPEYHDYHWILGPHVEQRVGAGAGDTIAQALLGLDSSNEQHARILDAYGASAIIEANAEDYAQIEDIARELNLLG